MLQFSLTEVVYGKVVGYTEGVESDIANVSLAVDGVGKEGKGLGLFDGKAGAGTGCFCVGKISLETREQYRN
jgi:hypothetical protein